VVRVRLIEGTGAFKLNGRPLEDYFPNPAHRRLVTEPLRVTNTLERYDVLANLDGGGVSGRRPAPRHLPGPGRPRRRAAVRAEEAWLPHP
jgi:small subunit ribosomal protein S9